MGITYFFYCMITIAGYAKSVDRYGRIHLIFPDISENRDSFNTRQKITSFENCDYHPYTEREFIIKPTARCVYVDCNPNNLLQRLLKIECEFIKFENFQKINKGWYIKAHSIILFNKWDK